MPKQIKAHLKLSSVDIVYKAIQRARSNLPNSAKLIDSNF